MSVEYQYITTGDARDLAIRALSCVDRLGVDIEGDSLYHYNDRATLIQISGGNKNYIFDPILLDSVSGLGPLFENRSILKIFHGSEYDITSLKRDFGFKIGPIFDTALAARAIGLTRWSLKELVSHFFGITLAKTHQKSNWSLRPLSQGQLDYACEDTIYLESLHSLLTEAIQKKERVDQIAEECRLLEDLTWSRKAFESSDYLRLEGTKALSSGAQKILRELCMARENVSREENLPPFKVAHNSDLVTLAVHSPQNEEAFMKLFSKGRIMRELPRWLDAIQRGIESAEPLPQRAKNGNPPMTISQQKIFARLRLWRDQQAKMEEVEAAMVVTTSLLKAISKKRPSTLAELASIPTLRQWHVNHYGTKLINEIAKGSGSVNHRQNQLPLQAQNDLTASEDQGDH
jgi:ribonuclease D